MGFVTTNPDRRWSRNRIPYEVSGRFTSGSVERAAIDEAILAWNATGAVELVEKQSTTEHCVAFVYHKDTMSSAIGRDLQSGRTQEINCNIRLFFGFPTGSIIHEIGHAIGILHEHQRPDRDDYLKVDYAPEEATNFAKERGEKVGPYDLNSIMHYAESTKDKRKLSARVEKGDLGQRTVISPGDIYAALVLKWGLPSVVAIQSAHPRRGGVYMRLDGTQKQQPQPAAIRARATHILPLDTLLIGINKAFGEPARVATQVRNVTADATDGARGGIVNCQSDVQSWEKFRVGNVGGDQRVIASEAFPMVFVRMAARSLTSPAPGGGGLVDTQVGLGQLALFDVREIDGALALESAATPGRFLRIDGTPMFTSERQIQRRSSGGGVVNAQFGVDGFTRLRFDPPVVKPPAVAEARKHRTSAPKVDPFEFVPHLDSSGTSVGRLGQGMTLAEMKALALSRDDVIAFNTNGDFKSALRDRSEWTRWTDDPNQGMYVKREPTASGQPRRTIDDVIAIDAFLNVGRVVVVPADPFEFVPHLDSSGSNIGRLGEGMTLEEMQALALSRDDVVAFNTNGYFKSALRDRTEWIRWTDDPNQGLYIQRRPTADGPSPELIDPFEFVPQLDSSGSDVGRLGEGMTLEEMKALALSRDDVVAFNTNGYFKSALRDRSEWTRWTNDPNQGTYIKLTSNDG